MEANFAKNFITSSYAKFPMRRHSTDSIFEEFCRVPLISRRDNTKLGRSLMIPWSKRSTFQDFQGFAEPLRLLPATEAKTYSNKISEEIFSSMELEESVSFYMVELCTSKDFGSSLKDLNAGILLCLIDEYGNSMLQRISAASLQHSGDRESMVFSESIHFQRGSFDIAIFKGPKLGKIEALWIGLESGSWRLAGIRLTAIFGPLSLARSLEDTKKGQLNGLQYEFEASNILLGEGGESIAELRPILVNELSRDNLSTLTNSDSPPASLFTLTTSNEESMREYSDLKLSLLLYDFILILGGSTILAFSSSLKTAYSFLVGGICGFLYLLLLQRSVDGLSSPSSPATDNKMVNFVQALNGFKGTLLSLALTFVTGILAVKYGTGGSSMTLTAVDLFVGVAGFLACKISVVLAAFKPIKNAKDT